MTALVVSNDEIEDRRAAAGEAEFAHHRAHGLGRQAKRLLAERKVMARQFGELAEAAEKRPGTGVEMLDAAAFLVGEDRCVFAPDRLAEALDQDLRLAGLAQIAPADEEAERVGFAKQGELVVRECWVW